MVLIVSLFLPSHYKVKRQIIINATMEEVFSQVNDFNKMQGNGTRFTYYKVKRYTIVNNLYIKYGKKEHY